MERFLLALGLSACLISRAHPATARETGASLPASVASADLAAQDLAQNKDEEALSQAAAAVSADPKNARAWTLKAMAEIRLNLYEEALGDSTQCLVLAPENGIARQTRAWALNELGRYQEALTDAAGTLDREPNNPLAQENRAFALAGLGFREEALAALRRAASSDEGLLPLLQQAQHKPTAQGLVALLGAQNDSADKIAATSPGAVNAPFAAAAGQPERAESAVSAAPETAAGEVAGFTARRHLILLLSGALLAALMLLNFFWAGRGQPKFPADCLPSQYEPLRLLSNSPRGELYEARDRVLGRLVAVRKVPSDIRASPESKKILLDGVRVLASLSHPNIVDFYSIAQDGRSLCLVFAFVGGKTLSALVKDRPLTFDAAARVLKGACEALDYAHGKNVVHGRLRSARVMVSENGLVTVLGLGVGLRIEEALTHTTSRASIGDDSSYRAPEERQDSPSAAGDVYCAAVCFYEWLSGRLPFEGDPAAVQAAKLKGEFPAVSSLVKRELPAGLDEIFSRALSSNPESRYARAGDFLAAVLSLPRPPRIKFGKNGIKD
jgi:serine/threonine-protein kinase